MAYEAVEPFGEWRADVRSATICAVIANVFREKGQDAAEIADFMPTFEAKPAQTQNDMIAIAAQITATMGGRIDI